DHLAVQSILYTPKNGDVVVIDAFTEYGKPIVKRIIGIEGDILDINAETSKVSINGEVLDEPYVNTLTSQGDKFDYPIVIPYGKIFVMGDNRAESLDSRSLGFIDKRDILGKVLLRLTPLSTAGKIK
ncbi:MAG: signal peptidase I, partial [Oscillospiraceae bacterium]